MRIVPDMLTECQGKKTFGLTGYYYNNLEDGEKFRFIHRPKQIYKMVRTGSTAEHNCKKCALKSVLGVRLCDMSNCMNILKEGITGYNRSKRLEVDYNKCLSGITINDWNPDCEDEKYILHKEKECKSGYIELVENVSFDLSLLEDLKNVEEPAHGQMFKYYSARVNKNTLCVAVKKNSCDNYDEEYEDCDYFNCYLCAANCESEDDEDGYGYCEDEGETLSKCIQQYRKKENYHIVFMQLEV